MGTEAAFHGVEEYMKYVEEYYQELEVRQGYPVETKRVYVATDEPKVLAECRRKFPEYTFLGDVSISKSASVSNRYNADSLRGIIVDIYMLSLTDYIVGTFSSQVRLSVDLTRYRVRHVVVDLGWVDTYFGCSTTCPILPGQLEVWQNGLWSWAG